MEQVNDLEGNKEPLVRGRRVKWWGLVLVVGGVGFGIVLGLGWEREWRWGRFVERMRVKDVELVRIVRGRNWPVRLPGMLREIVDEAWPMDVSVYVQQVGGPSYVEVVKFDDADLAELCGWSEITFLSAANSQITDAWMPSLARLPRLRELYLVGAEVTDEGLAEISRVKTLEMLSLGGTSITDGKLKALCALPRLEHLVLWGTMVSDEGLKVLEGFPALKELDVANTEVTEAGIAMLRKRKAGLTTRQLDGNGTWVEK